MSRAYDLSRAEWSEYLSTPEEELADFFLYNPRVKDGVYSYWGIPPMFTWEEAMDLLCSDYKAGGKTKKLVGMIDERSEVGYQPRPRKGAARRFGHGRYSSLAMDVLRRNYEDMPRK